MGTKSLYQSFQNSFSASYFRISQEPLDQSSLFTHYGKIIESSKCSENKNGQNYINQGTGRQLFQISVMLQRP